jgi:hypothetical protein
MKGTSTVGLTEVEPGKWTTVTHTVGDATAQLMGGIPDRDLPPITRPGKYAGGVGLVRWFREFFL